MNSKLADLRLSFVRKVAGWTAIHTRGLHMAGGRAEAARAALAWLDLRVGFFERGSLSTEPSSDDILTFLDKLESGYKALASCMAEDHVHRWYDAAAIEVFHLKRLVKGERNMPGAGPSEAGRIVGERTYTGPAAGFGSENRED